MLGELRRLASAHEDEIRFPHFRDKDGCEVDVVLERTGRKLAGAAGKRFTAGVVLYDGETSAGFGDNLYAVPIRALWEKTA